MEPFVGGLAVTLGLAPKSALLNDLNPHLIAFYRWLQKGIDVKRSGVKFQNSRTTFAVNRTRFNDLINSDGADSIEAACLFYYLNRTCFNGLCRFNSKGLFNVPFGQYRSINYVDSFERFTDTLSPYSFTHGDFTKLRTKPTDFIYADPPYDVQFTSYSAGGFNWEDQVRLATWLAKHRGPVIASNQATSRIVRLYRGLGFSLRFLDGPRRISCTGDRSAAREILATKGL